MKYRFVIFDFDGTLANSFPFFLATINRLADEHGFRHVHPDDVQTLRTYDARQVLRHLGLPVWKVPLVAASFRTRMASDIDNITRFDGVDTLLKALKQKGVFMSLITSNSFQNAQRVLGFQNMAHFSHPQCGTALFGKTAKLKRLLRTMEMAPDDAIYIGDEIRDIEAARMAGMHCGAVGWGYTTLETLRRQQPDHLFNSFEEIVEKLL